MLRAYSGLCAGWVGERAPRAARPAQHRFFKMLFAAPLFGCAGATAAAALGSGLIPAFLTLISIFLTVLAASAFVRRAGSHIAALTGLGALISAGAGALMPLTGLSILMPLALIAGGETFYVTRSRRHACLAGAAACGLALMTGGFAGIGASDQTITLAVTALAMAHMASFAGRDFSSVEMKLAAKPVSPADALLKAKGVVTAKLSLTGEVLEVAGDCESALGLSASILKGFALYDRVLVGDRVAYLSALDDIRAGKNSAAADVRLRDASGEGAYFRVAMALCKMPGFIAMSMERRAEAPATAASQPAEAQIHADRYLASVSHELRTPLNAILGFSDILKQEMFGPLANERQREYVGLIHQSGAHLLSVVNMILDVSKIDMGAYQIIAEPFDVSEAVSMSLAMVREQAGAKRISLTAALDAAVPDLTGDRRAFQQILINLLSNAVKFTPEGGSVRVEAGEHDGYLALAVHDSGIGISEADLERIGQPFFQVNSDYTRSFEGTGLGLSLVRGLVELHAGGLSIESGLGKGTTVTVRLPVAGPDRARGARPVKLSERRPGLAAQLLTGGQGNGADNEQAIRKTA